MSILFACSASKDIAQSNTEKIIDNVQVSDLDLIEKCFNFYKSALMKSDGNEACKYVDSKTIAYYDQAMKNAKYLDSSSVAQMNVMDKLMILAIRHRTPKDLLYSFDAKKMIVYAIENGMVGQQGFDKIQFSKYEIVENYAKVFIDVSGAPMPFFLEFNKEDDD